MRSALRPDSKLRLARSFSHVVECDGGVVLLEDEGSSVLLGNSIEHLIRRIDGSSTACSIASVPLQPYSSEEVLEALARLHERGIVVEVDGSAPEEAESSVDVEATRVFERAAGDVTRDRYTLIDVEHQLGGGWPPLVVVADYLEPALARHDRLAFQTGRPYILARLAWDGVWLGPYVDPGRSACWHCLRERLSLNIGARALVNAADATAHAVRAVRQPTFVGSADLLLELLKAFVGAEEGLASLRDALLTRGRRADTVERHPIRRLETCPLCGAGGRSPRGADFQLTHRIRKVGSLGGYRTVPPETTLTRYSDLVSPLTGVVRNLDRVTEPGPSPIHVYTANHAIHAGSPSLRSVTADHRDHSGGKGATDIDARVSGLCEALERFSALHRGFEEEIVASADELGSAAIGPSELLRFSEEQYEHRDQLNAHSRDGFQWIPAPYPSEAAISWTSMRSLVTGEERLVPTAAVYLGFDGPGAEYVKGDSNGLAGGNCLEEAVLQGLLELVERDAVAIWWYNRLHMPAVELREAGDPYVDAVVRYYQTLGRELWALDLTLDLGIPCYGALSARADGTEVIFGFGAHLDARVALRRSITELNQMLPTVLRSRDERARQLLPEFAEVIAWWDTACVDDHPYLSPDPHARPRSLRDHPLLESGDILEHVNTFVSRARGAGLDVLVCELTRPDVGFSTARVVVPGLRHFWRRLGSGRLYEVPVQLGLLVKPTFESEMNPVSMFV